MQTSKQCQVPVSRPMSDFSHHHHLEYPQILHLTIKRLPNPTFSIPCSFFQTSTLHYSCFMCQKMTALASLRHWRTNSLHFLSGVFMILILRQIKDSSNTSKATLTWTVKRQIMQLICTLNKVLPETPEFPPHRLSTVC